MRDAEKVQRDLPVDGVAGRFEEVKTCELSVFQLEVLGKRNEALVDEDVGADD